MVNKAVGFGLEAPLAVTVEVRAPKPQGRVFRLSRSLGEEGIRLARPAPFEIGREVRLRFSLPGNADGDADATLALRATLETTGDASEADGEHGGLGLRFIDPPSSDRQRVVDYVLDRLKLPRAQGPHADHNR